MTGHEPAEQERRSPSSGPRSSRSSSPGSSAGSSSSTTRASSSRRRRRRSSSRVRALLDPLVPLVEFRHRSWLEEDERADTLAFLERNGLAYVSVDAPRTRASNVVPPVAAATHAVAYVRFHGRNAKTWNIRSEKSWQRFDWMYSAEELAEWVDEARPARRAGGRGLRALQQQPRRLRAAERESILRGLLDEAGISAQRAASSRRRSTPDALSRHL